MTDPGDVAYHEPSGGNNTDVSEVVSGWTDDELADPDIAAIPWRSPGDPPLSPNETQALRRRLAP